MKLLSKLAKAKYAYNKDNETHILVELEAPKVEWEEKRSPICIVPVIDVSTSMSGHKLDYVKKACRKLIDHLAPGDFIGVVSFGSDVFEIAPICEVTQHQKEDLKKKIGKLEVTGCTNMAGGLLQGFQWINNADLPKNVVLRILLFTDGHANVGVSGRNLLGLVKENCGNATVSCFGFGNGCDQELLADMSNQASGNYAFIDSPDAALTAFARELGGLMSTYGQNIKVTLTPDKNNQILEVLNDEDVDEDNGKVIISLRDILGEEKKWIVAKVLLSKVEKALPRSVNAIKVGVSYSDQNGKLKTVPVQPVKVQFCKPGEEPDQEDKDVVLHRDRLLAGKAQDVAEELARKGDYKGAVLHLEGIAARMSDTDIVDHISGLTANYSTASAYSGTRGISNTSRSLLKGKRVSCTSTEGESFGAKVGARLHKNTVMNRLVSNFTSDDGSENTNNKSGSVSVNVTTNNPVVVVAPDTEDKSKSTNASKKRSKRDW